MLNAFPAVIKILSSLDRMISVSAGVRQLIQSILLVVIQRRSCRRFSSKEYGRFLRSVVCLAELLAGYEGPENHEQDVLKYFLNCTMCKALGDPSRPPRPEWLRHTSLFTGWLKRWLAIAVARKDMTLLYSLLQTKRYWPKLSETREEQALMDHKQLLSSRDSEGNLKIRQLPDDLRKEIFRTSDEVFKKLPPPTKLMPSSNGCFQAPRRKGGARSLFSPLENPVDAPLGYLRTLLLDFESWKQRTFAEARDRSVEELINNDPFDSDVLKVKVEILAEPGKFRLITKGDGFLYTALQPAQGQLLQSWKRRPESTMKASVQEQVNRIWNATRTHTDWVWISGDYKSATDLLLSQCSFTALAPLINLAEHELCVKSMGPTKVYYPDGDSLTQFGGQLMGHPLSFPLLCVVNLAAYRCAIRRWVASGGDPDEAKLLLDNVIVNGDDICFRCPPEFFEFWRSATSDAGLVLSPGKNYFSSIAVMINSQFFVRSGHSMVRRGYLNLKLLTGYCLKDGDSSATPDQLGKDLNEMVEFCPWSSGMVPHAFSRFKSDWRGWFTPNFYLPVHLGGYGLNTSFAPTNTKVTLAQRRVAARFVNDIALPLYRHTGMSLPILKRMKAIIPSMQMIPILRISNDDFLMSEDVSNLVARLASIGWAQGLPGQKTSDRILIGRPSQYVKGDRSPMSKAGLFEYWTVAIVPTSTMIDVAGPWPLVGTGWYQRLGNKFNHRIRSAPTRDLISSAPSFFERAPSEFSDGSNDVDLESFLDRFEKLADEVFTEDDIQSLEGDSLSHSGLSESDDELFL